MSTAEYDDVRHRLGDADFTLVNVLPEAAHELAHIPGSISLPLATIPSRAADVLPDKAADIVVYCAGPT